MSKKKFFAVFGVFTLLIVGIYIYYNHAGISADTSSARAVDTSYAVDSKTKWDQGALKNVDDSTGAAKMDTKHMWESNFTGWTQTNSIVTHPGYDGFEFDDWCLSQINRDGGMCIHSIHGTFQAILDMGSIHWYPSLSFIPNLDANSGANPESFNS